MTRSTVEVWGYDFEDKQQRDLSIQISLLECKIADLNPGFFERRKLVSELKSLYLSYDKRVLELGQRPSGYHG